MKESESTKLYICNRKRCLACSDRCLYTSDKNFAKYKEHKEFDYLHGYEWERGELPHEHANFEEVGHE